MTITTDFNQVIILTIGRTPSFAMPQGWALPAPRRCKLNSLPYAQSRCCVSLISLGKVFRVIQGWPPAPKSTPVKLARNQLINGWVPTVYLYHCPCGIVRYVTEKAGQAVWFQTKRAQWKEKPVQWLAGWVWLGGWLAGGGCLVCWFVG